MRNFNLRIFFICFLVFLITILMACGTTSSVHELPPVFDNIDSFHDRSFSSINLPRVYQNVHKNIESQDWSVNLISEVDLPPVPSVLKTYRIIRPNVDNDYAQKIAEQIGIYEPIQEKSQNYPFHQSRYFYIPASDPTRIYLLEISQDGSISIHFNASPGEGNMPSNQECINIARDWLKSHNLYPTGILKIATSPTIKLVMLGREEQEWTVATTVSFKKIIDEYELLGMGAYVSIGNAGEICEVYINAPKLKTYSTTNIKDPQLALDNLQDYLREPSMFFAYSPECLISHIESTMTIKEVSIKYFPMLSEDFDNPVYAQPIYVFKGQAYPKSSGAYPFDARVDASAR